MTARDARRIRAGERRTTDRPTLASTVRALTVVALAVACERERGALDAGPIASAPAPLVSPHDPGPHDAGPHDAGATACSRDGGATDLPAGPCAKNEDCALTEQVVECDACNTGTLYAAARRAVDERERRCGPPTCKPEGCPPPDTYSAAFWRAECRAGRCVRFRWHSGG